MITRRYVVGLLAGLVPLLALSRARAEGACDSLKSLSRSQRRMRDVVGFQLDAEGERQCRDCAFFTADTTTSNCGSCELLNEGPVYATSVCESWGEK